MNSLLALAPSFTRLNPAAYNPAEASVRDTKQMLCAQICSLPALRLIPASQSSSQCMRVSERGSE